MRTSRRWWDWAWSAWLAATLTSFGVLEAMALRRRTHPTLSATLARWMGCHPRSRYGPAVVAMFGAFWLWLSVHVLRWEPRNA